MVLGGYESREQRWLPGEGDLPVGVSSLHAAHDDEMHAHWLESCPPKLMSAWTL